MAVTIPPTWQLQQRQQIRPGGPVIDDIDHDLEALNQRIGRNMAHNVRSVLAQGGRRSEPIEPDTGEPQLIAALHIPVWRSPMRIAVHAYGENVVVGVSLGALFTDVLIPSGGGSVWASGPPASGAVLRDGDGDALLEIYASADGGGTAELIHWVVEELPLTALPDADADTEYQALDDVRFSGELPLSGWLQATLDGNAREVLTVRTRGAARGHTQGDLPSLSSIFARGIPTVLEASEWGQSARAVYTLGAREHDVTVSCMSEWETLDDAAARVVTLTPGPAAKVAFDNIAIRVPGATRVYLVIISEAPTDELGYAYSVVETARRISGRYSLAFGNPLNSTEPVDWPEGRALYARDVDSPVDGAPDDPSPGLTQAPPVGRYDLAHLQADNANTPVLLSPTPRLRPAPSGTQWQVYGAGILDIHGECVVEVADYRHTPQSRRNAAGALRLPSFLSMRQTVERANTHTQRGTPQCGITYLGQRWAVPVRTEPAGSPPRDYDFIQRGLWRFVADTEDWITVGEWVLPSNPIAGTDINPMNALARVFVFAVATATQRAGASVPVSFRLVVDGSPGEAVTRSLRAPHIYADGLPITGYDAGLAAAAFSEGPTRSYYEHSYVQQAEWLAEAGAVFIASPAVVAPLGSNYPAFVELQVDASSAAGALEPGVWVVCAQPECWIGPRT